MLTVSESGASEQMTRGRIYSNEVYVFSKRLLWILVYLVYFESSVLCSIFRKGCIIQGGSNMTGTDLCVNKPHCAAAVRP